MLSTTNLNTSVYSYSSNKPNEDTHIIANVPDLGTVIGVFDGHSGRGGAQHLADQLEKLAGAAWASDGGETDTAHDRMSNLFASLDDSLLKRLNELPDEQQERQGSVYTEGVISILTPDRLLTGNVGDCKAVLGTFADGEWHSTELTKKRSAVDILLEPQSMDFSERFLHLTVYLSTLN